MTIPNASEQHAIAEARRRWGPRGYAGVLDGMHWVGVLGLDGVPTVYGTGNSFELAMTDAEKLQMNHGPDWKDYGRRFGLIRYQALAMQQFNGRRDPAAMSVAYAKDSIQQLKDAVHKQHGGPVPFIMTEGKMYELIASAFQEGGLVAMQVVEIATYKAMREKAATGHVATEWPSKSTVTH